MLFSQNSDIYVTGNIYIYNLIVFTQPPQEQSHMVEDLKMGAVELVCLSSDSIPSTYLLSDWGMFRTLRASTVHL